MELWERRPALDLLDQLVRSSRTGGRVEQSRARSAVFDIIANQVPVAVDVSTG